MTRTKAVPALVSVLGVVAMIVIVGLQQRAADSRDAQVHVATVRTELTRLQLAPLKSSPRTGGSPALARQLLLDGKREVAANLGHLRTHSPVAALDAVDAPLRADYRTLDAIYALGATGATVNESATRAARLVGVAAAQVALVDRALSDASEQYDERASVSADRATAGTAATIAILLLSFILLYRRSVRARALAESLAATNGEEARTDPLTGLGNRRALTDALERELLVAGDHRQLVLALLDLDGFKQYNDTFGHPAGDALLTRLATNLQSATRGMGTAYRLGGDEFCVLTCEASDHVVRLAAAALTVTGDAFEIGCSYGRASIPAEASSADAALRLADQRMYEHKAGRSSFSRQSCDLLLKVLSERSTDLRAHVDDVALLAKHTAQRLMLPDQEVQRIVLAAELHDVGKTAVPDAILNKPGPLDESEWQFMRRHTLIGERILLAAPSLASAAELVRWSHERYDGTGYPDAIAASEIPLGSSIIAVCDAFDAMVSDRPYRAAMPVADAYAELQRGAGSQFDPAVVDAFIARDGDRSHLMRGHSPIAPRTVGKVPASRPGNEEHHVRSCT